MTEEGYPNHTSVFEGEHKIELYYKKGDEAERYAFFESQTGQPGASAQVMKRLLTVARAPSGWGSAPPA